MLIQTAVKTTARPLLIHPSPKQCQSAHTQGSCWPSLQLDTVGSSPAATEISGQTPHGQTGKQALCPTFGAHYYLDEMSRTLHQEQHWCVL